MRTLSSRTSLTPSRISLLAACALFALSAQSEVLKRWKLAGDPHGIALGADGIIYVGLAEPQSIVAIDPASGAIKQKVVLDSAEIASTKELVTLRTDRAASRLFIANGSDESATIVVLPTLKILREITIEGEPIRDALPDPKGRYLYLLGRRVHVYDAGGGHELRSIPTEDPTAIAASATRLAVFNRDGVTFYDANSFAEVGRKSLHDPIEASFYAGDTLVALGRGALIQLTKDELVRDSICLPEKSGPQIAVAASPSLLLLAERRCNSSAFSASEHRVMPASLYGVDAYALAYDRAANVLYATDRAGYLTIYKVPRVPVVK